MFEPGTVKSNYLSKRSHDCEEKFLSKRIKCDISDIDESDNETESKYSSSELSDIEEEEDSNISTDQSQYNKSNIHQHSLSSHSKTLIKQFKYLYNHSQRNVIQLTQNIDENLNQIKKLRYQLKYSFNRNDLFKEGYAILSDELFPFYSLCYLCGSMGNDLIYCNSCCQAYHRACLNESERPYLCPTPESWLCPNCNVCNICGLLKTSRLISCSDCKRSFHIKCLKHTKDDQQNPIRNSIWFCPSCIKCDCGQMILSNEQNLLSVTKSYSSQQSLMCIDCLNNMKILRTTKPDQIQKCHLCEKFIEQFITKAKPLFSLSLIGNQTTQEKPKHLLQCIKCKSNFHPKCDGYLNEDVTLIPFIKNLSANIICSKCDLDQREAIKNSLTNYKIQVVKNTIANMISTLQIMISEETRLNDMKRYMSNLEQLHLSRNQSLNLHAFINDLLVIIQRLLDNLDHRQWQAAIDNCINSQCPWFKSSNLSSKTLLCSSINSSISHSNLSINRCSIPPSIDHIYSLNNERILFKSNVYKNNLLTSSDSLLRYIDNKIEIKNSTFVNLYQLDTRICQLCQTYADQFSSNISRLISIGINQWVHIGCILPAYTKTLDQSPYILHNIREIVNRYQTKYKCDICFKMGATVQCYESDCNTRYHCQCIDLYYSKLDRNLQEKLNIINGLLPNLTTLCSKHNKQKIKSDSNTDEINTEINLPKLKSINLSSTVYADLSNTSLEFSLSDIKLCIGSLQIKSLGNFDYLLDHDPNLNIYPNKYHASRVFWSTKNAREKTIYHLHIDIEQTYHNEKSNHQTIEYPLTAEQLHIEQLYKTCEKYFNKHQNKISKRQSLQTLLNNNQFTRALVQALQNLDQTKQQEPIFSYYIPQIDGTIDEENDLIELYQQWLISKYGRIKFTIVSDDGYKIISENLDYAWSTIVNLVRECRDDMNLTHLSMSNEELNGHNIFGLTKSFVKIMLNILLNEEQQTETIILSNEKNLIKKRKNFSSNSRLNIYQRKTSQRQRFNWLLNPNRKLQYALKSFQIDPALEHARRILLEESSIHLRLYHLKYFSQRCLIVTSSSIHGCGLFTLIDLVEGQMIIEYTGEIVRPCLTDKRERENEIKGFGCYMFTVDSMNVIDATHQGNKARFINHNCQPNCYAKTILSNGIKHIVIYALIDIPRGSELTYDYSFPEEDIKIPCHCVKISNEHCDVRRIEEHYMNNLSAFHLLQTKAIRSKLFDYELGNHNFCPKDDNDIDLLIVITSKASSHVRRNAIRRTYGNLKNVFKHIHDTSSKLEIRILFMITIDEHRMKNILFEQEVFHDIVQVKIPDDYLMNTYRDLAILDWSSKFCHRARFILKIDDSVFLNPFLVLKFINENENDRLNFEARPPLDVNNHCLNLDARLPLFYGLIHANEYVLREDLNINEESENLIVSKDEYPCETYPNYLDNNAYLISNDARDLILCTITRQPDVLLPLSNIYITGILPEYLNIERQSLIDYKINIDKTIPCEKFFIDTKSFACVTNIKSSKNIFEYYSNYWQIIVKSQMKNL